MLSSLSKKQGGSDRNVLEDFSINNGLNDVYERKHTDDETV